MFISYDISNVNTGSITALPKTNSFNIKDKGISTPFELNQRRVLSQLSVPFGRGRVVVKLF